MAKAQKEVAKHPHMGSREESFGSAPPEIAVGGGTMHTFGYKPHAGVWPTKVESCDVKSGFPQGYDKTKKTPKP
jgi:hypothetical protein